MNNPFMNMKTPQQYQQELDQMQKRYTQQYNSIMNPVGNVNSYGWKYQESENEIDNLQVPANGTPYMLVGNGIFYIKKFVNGQSYISAYSFQPINNMGEPQKAEKQPDFASILDDISQRLTKLEEKINEQ